MRRAVFGILLAALAAQAIASEPAGAVASGAAPAILDNVHRRDGVYTLDPGAKVEGVVLVHQGDWPPQVIHAFHETPWLDAASVRLRWADLEPQDQRFRWEPFDKVLAEVKGYNAAHPGAHRTLHVRVMGGVHCPRWFEKAGVRYYDTSHPTGHHAGKPSSSPLHIPVPYDNPVFLKQLREVYRAMVERYGDEPPVTVYHGTWSAGPWDEIFHPQGAAALPPGYTPERFVRGMVQQLDVLLDEFCMKGKVAELPYSGKYPTRRQIDITGPLTARIVERLGRRSPYLTIQSNGWGMTSQGVQTVSWGHEPDVDAAFGSVSLAFQALGTNAGGGWFPQGDWLPLVKLAEKYDAAYLEIYPPDLLPLDTKHHIVEAMDGFHAWLKKRNRTLYVRDGTITRMFRSGGSPRRVERIAVSATAPEATTVDIRVRTRLSGAAWSPWQSDARLADLPPGDEAQLEVRLHTDDGCVTPTITATRLDWR